MNKFYLMLLLLFLNNSQIICRTIVISTTPQIVPKGKIWVLDLKSKPIIEFSELTYNLSSYCNTNLKNDLKQTAHIVDGKENFNFVDIVFKKINKIQYLNTYQISEIVGFIKVDYGKENNYSKYLIYYPGQIVWVAMCLNSITLSEYNLSEAKKYEQKNKPKIKKEQESSSIGVNEGTGEEKTPDHYILSNNMHEKVEVKINPIGFDSTIIIQYKNQIDTFKIESENSYFQGGESGRYYNFKSNNNDLGNFSSKCIIKNPYNNPSIYYIDYFRIEKGKRIHIKKSFNKCKFLLNI